MEFRDHNTNQMDLYEFHEILLQRPIYNSVPFVFYFHFPQKVHIFYSHKWF